MRLVCLSLHFLLLLITFYTIVFICHRHVNPNGFPYLLRMLNIFKDEVNHKKLFLGPHFHFSMELPFMKSLILISDLVWYFHAEIMCHLLSYSFGIENTIRMKVFDMKTVETLIFLPLKNNLMTMELNF